MKPLALPFLRLLLLLTGVALLERGVFAAFHRTQLAVDAGGGAHALLWGLRFDLAVAAVLALAACAAAHLAGRLLRRPCLPWLRRLGYLAVVLLVGLQGADILYYAEAARHLGYELKEGYNSGGALLRHALVNHPGFMAGQLALLAAALYALRRLLPPARVVPLSFPRAEGRLLVALLLTVFLVRGGWQVIPLEPLHAQQIGDPQRAVLALNGAYNALFMSLSAHGTAPVLDQPPTPEQVARVRRLYPVPPTSAAPPARQPSVVMVLLESWSAAYMHSYGYDRVTTPFFDALREQSLTAAGMLAGGHRTTEGMFATFCSAQNPLGQTVAQSQLQQFDYACLPRLLRARGYATAFFQGTHENTSGTGAFAQLLGFADSHGIEDMATLRLPRNSWGAHDADVYAHVLEQARHLPRPFLLGINTNSTHDSRLPPDVTPWFAGDDRTSAYLNVLRLADGALEDFVTRLYATPGLEDTVLVLVADHAGPPGPADAGAMAAALSHYTVPFLLHQPGRPAQRVAAIASQRDVAPTLLQALGLPVPAWFSGLSLLSDLPPEARFADYYHAGVLGWLQGGRHVAMALTDGSCQACAADLQRCDARPCAEADRQRGEDALAFTTLSQHLLFAGQLQRLGAVLSSP